MSSGSPIAVAKNFVENVKTLSKNQSIIIERDYSACDNGLDGVGIYEHSIIDIKLDSYVRPIVFAHGWNSTPDTWEVFVDKTLLNTGIPFYAADLLGGVSPIDDTAQVLATAVKATRYAFRTKSVDIVSHSKGGLVSRRAIDILPSGSVAHLVAIAPPNHGVDPSIVTVIQGDHFGGFCQIPNLANNCRLSTIELLYKNIRENFNYICTPPLVPQLSNVSFGFDYTNCQLIAAPKDGVSYYTIAGDMRITGRDLGVLYRGDLIVPKNSSTYPWRADNAPYPLTPNLDAVLYSLNVSAGEVYGDPAMHINIHKQTSVDECVLDYLGYDFTCNLPNSNADPAEPPSPPLPPDQDNRAVSIPPGGSLTQAINLDKVGSTRFTVFSDVSINVSLSSLNGQLITPQTVESQGGQYAQFAGTQFGEGGYTTQYVLTPTIGSWDVIMSSPETTATVLLNVDMPSDLHLSVATSSDKVQPGESITITAWLLEATTRECCRIRSEEH